MGVFFLLCPITCPLTGSFQNGLLLLTLRIIRSVYINHFETPTNLTYVRPALARSLWNIV